ncbi:hypothetical protein [Nocardia sp. NPDC002869]|uniref:hypothetical protein n=1 Tax=Nocardia sp. NPDC002869 TaxID=3161032 RepID=UPI00398CB788
MPDDAPRRRRVPTGATARSGPGDLGAGGGPGRVREEEGEQKVAGGISVPVGLRCPGA